MKLLRNAAILANGLLLAGMLGACQNENDNALAPQAPATVSDRNAKTLTPPLLIKNGDDIIEYSYNGMGRPVLTKVTLPGKDKYVIYSYAPKQVIAKEYYLSSGLNAGSSTYTLDASGKCVESNTYGHKYGYQYNADGQLIKRFRKNMPLEKIEFSYLPDPSGGGKSLDKIKLTDNAGNFLREVQFSYSVPNKLIWPDLNPLNPQYLQGTTQYLTIFGKFATNLPRLILDNFPSQNTNKTYQVDYYMNSNGLPENIYHSDLGGANMVKTDLKYLSPIAGQ